MIGYLTFGRDELGYGLALCLDGIKDAHRVTPKTAKYVKTLLFSCFWWEHIYHLADFLRKSGIKKTDSDRPRIVVGGFNTFNPVPFQAYADAVVCGDGEEIIQNVLAGADPGLVWRNVPSLRGFCHETNDIARIEIARGCKFHCKFCAVSRIKPYREVPIEEIEGALRSTKSKRVSLFSPETQLHSHADEIDELCDKYGKSRMDSDVSLRNLNKRSVKDLIPRFGLEGMSERLRFSVGKRFSDDMVCQKVEKAIYRGLKALTFYVILDLPGEEEQDWEAFSGLFDRIGRVKGASNFTLFPFPNTFNPNPHTVFEMEPIHWDRDYYTRWQGLFCWEGNRGASGMGLSSRENPWGVKVVAKSRIPIPSTRILSMISLRAGEEFCAIEEELTRKKVISIRGGRIQCHSLDGLLQTLKLYGGVERYCGPRTAKDAPWKRLVIPRVM